MGSVPHQRMVGYLFGGLCCLVRLEANGYLRGQQAGNDAALAKTNSDISTADYRSQISSL